MLAIRIKQAPASFPYRDAIAGTWTVIYFTPAGENMTQVRIVGLGYTTIAGIAGDAQVLRRRQPLDARPHREALLAASARGARRKSPQAADCQAHRCF